MCVETQSVSKTIGDRFPKQQGRKANLLEGSRREEGGLRIYQRKRTKFDQIRAEQKENNTVKLRLSKMM